MSILWKFFYALLGLFLADMLILFTIVIGFVIGALIIKKITDLDFKKHKNDLK